MKKLFSILAALLLTTQVYATTSNHNFANLGVTAVVASNDTDWALDDAITVENVGTITNKSFWSKQVGDMLMVRGTFTAGTPVAAAFAINLGGGRTIDSAKFGTILNMQIVGKMHQPSTTGTENIFSGANGGALIFDDASTDKVFGIWRASGAGVFEIANGNALVVSGGNMSFNFQVPISGWVTGNAAVFPKWTAYTPTIGAGVGTPTGVSFFYKEFGDHIKIRGTLTTGTVAGSYVTISLPGSYTVSAAKTLKANTEAQAGPPLGKWTFNGANQYGHIVSATGTSDTVVYLANAISVANPLVPVFGSTIVGSTTEMFFEFEVPVQ